MNKIRIKDKTILDKGWSDDKKYCITDENDEKYLLRISTADKYDQKKLEFDMMNKVFKLGVPINQPIEFGTNDEGVFLLLSWIEGEDAEDSISSYSDTDQYVFGLEAGRYLKKIHSIPSPPQSKSWEARFNEKIDTKIQKYLTCSHKFDHDEGEILIEYINSNRHLLKNRPQCFQQGDYHIGNMIINNKAKKLSIIDFNRFDFGDPFEEFNRIIFSVKRSPLFSSGLINGYFDNRIPDEFWNLLALYITVNTLSSLEWSIRYGQIEIEKMKNNCTEILKWYDSLNSVIPKWYFKGYYLQSIDGLFYKLRGSFDFGFLKKFGTVFKIFDDQDSGNICFGIKQNENRFFVKFAGAPTEQYDGEPTAAIERLKSSVSIYETLHHDNLIKYIQSEKIGNGFAVIFEWCDSECLGRMFPSSHRKFNCLNIELKKKIFNDILSFFVYLSSQKFVAIDFYDGSILYDFVRNKTTICDIDFFRKMPVINEVGRMYGSSLFQSPEELIKGEVIDEVTNVYTLGATAFAVFADFDRSGKKWNLSSNSLKVAQKAVSNERSKRQQSILEFANEWKNSF